MLIIIQSKSGQVFGGYTSIGYSQIGNYQDDKKAFLFQIQKKKKIEQNGSYAYGIYSNSGYHATWGGGHDLHICNDSNTVNSSYSNLGHTY